MQAPIKRQISNKDKLLTLRSLLVLKILATIQYLCPYVVANYITAH